MSKIKSIKVRAIGDETLHNIAVENDESYIAEGVVVHNCRSVLIPITIYEDLKPTKKIGSKSVDKFIDDNIGKGFSIR